MSNLNSFEDIHTCFGHKDVKYIYQDKNFDIKGIDYTNYIKIRFETVNNAEIKSIYSIKGWYLLNYLMCEAQYAQYITTTITHIESEIKLTVEDITISLKTLQTKNIINIKENKFNKNTTLHIAIGYNNDNILPLQENGYRAIPVEYIKTVLPTLVPEEWSLLTIFIVRHSYFSFTKVEDKETGEVIFGYRSNGYAFPTQEEMIDLLGLSDRTIRKYSRSLAKSRYHPIEINKGLKRRKQNQRFDTENNTYYIPLLMRIEYIYNHILKLEDKRKKEDIDKIKKLGFEKVICSIDQKIITARDYLEFKYRQIIEQYRMCLDEKNVDLYKSIAKFIE